jgi:hypothetical protein
LLFSSNQKKSTTRQNNGESTYWVTSYLQGLATNEVGPPADLGRDALGTGELFAHALREENGRLLGANVSKAMMTADLQGM